MSPKVGTFPLVDTENSVMTWTRSCSILSNPGLYLRQLDREAFSLLVLLLILKLEETYSFQQFFQFQLQVWGVAWLVESHTKKRVWIFLSLDQPKSKAVKFPQHFANKHNEIQGESGQKERPLGITKTNFFLDKRGTAASEGRAWPQAHTWGPGPGCSQPGPISMLLCYLVKLCSHVLDLLLSKLRREEAEKEGGVKTSRCEVK